MFFIFLLLVPIFTTEIHGLNNTSSQNKTKRTLNHQISNYGDTKPVVVYVDNVPSGSSNPQNGEIANSRISFGNTPVKSFFEVPKVAAQQVLYEFQQTPTNAVSNVHVKQLFHHPGGESSDNNNYEQNPAPENHQNQYSASETVVQPIQHSAYTNHGQNYAHVNYHPLYNIQPHHVQSQQFVPGKYFYVNGRIVYQPTPALQQNQQKLPLKYGSMYQPPQKLMPPSVHQPPASYSRFVPPQRHEMQAITSPITPASPTTKPPAPVKAVEEDDEEENASIQENEDDVEETEEDDERSNKYQEDEDVEEEDGDRNPVFGRYQFDEDEELEDRERYRDGEEEVEEDDEDNRGGSSKNISKKTRKSPKKKSGKSGKYNNKDNYSYSEGYSTSSKYEYPSKKKKNNGKKGVKSQKSVRYSSKGTARPQIEGRYSENIPITHKHKIFKEKWYVTKKTDDNLERSSEEY